MNLLDFLTSPWAILPDRLLELQAIYATHLRGEKIDVEAIEARLGRPLANEQQTYALREGGVAVLPISGVLSPKANLFMRISGGQSMQMLAEQVRSMAADSRVRSAIIAADSPGGSVLGTPALAQAVSQLAAEKPTVTVGEGTMASAMYWIGSAANAVFIEGATDLVGSIGVVATHDYDPAQRKISTSITAGKYKRMASPDAPLSAEGKAYLQSQVDHIYSVFVDAVAQHRGTSAEKVLEHMADGRVFIGQQAIDAGLVDGVSTVEAMVERLATNPTEFAQRRKAVLALGGLPAQKDEPVPPVAASTTTSEGNPVTQATTTLTRESLERDHAALYAQLRSEFTAAGAETERARIAQVRAQLVPGHEALIDKLAADGKSTGGDAAMAILAAQKAQTEAAAKAHADDAPNAAKASHAPDDKPAGKTKEQQVIEAQAYAVKNGCDFVTAMKRLGFVQ